MAPDPVGRARATVPGLAAVGVVAAVAWFASRSIDLSPLVIGVVLGAVVGNVVAVPAWAEPGVGVAARTLLRAGIVLLGVRLSLGDLAGLGADGLIVVAAVVALTFFGAQWLARAFGVGDDLGLLVGTGYSICGASAIAAMNGVVDADDEELAYALAMVTLCGTLSIAVLPVIGDAVGLADVPYGTWVGAAVHDVGQVVATASHGGDAALEAATVVKLSRVVLLAPLVAFVALRRRRSGEIRADGTTPPLVPLFIVGFLVAIVVRTSGVLGDDVIASIADVEKILFTLALVALGAGVRVAKIRQLGGRPLALGLTSWVLVAGVAYAGTLLVSG